ncbi:MAG: hypothetical protein RTU30_13770 [Candidatus Thorarchaeota archaeon]
MSLLGKYRKEERDREDDETVPPRDSEMSTATTGTTTKEVEPLSAVPNNERKSPIMSFSVASDLRTCLQAVRNEKAINLSMWVERTLRDTVTREFPEIAKKHLR